MKYIKTYEKCTEEEKLIYDDCSDIYYWEVSNKYPDILIVFDKLGVRKNFGDWLWREDNHLLKNFYLFRTEYENGYIGWTYSGLDFENPAYRKPPVFMGKVEITDEDRKRWELKQTSKKYNL